VQNNGQYREEKCHFHHFFKKVFLAYLLRFLFDNQAIIPSIVRFNLNKMLSIKEYPRSKGISEVSEKVAQFFLKRMKLLIVEDDEKVRETLEGFFSTPFIQVEKASNTEEAFLAFSSSANPWHCWIIDINLGRLSGLEILKKNQQFPFAIIYSGIGSMEQAAQAVKLGAAEVIDKKPDSIFKLIIKTCNLIPIGILCKGFLPKNTHVFFLLKENLIKNQNDWAGRANLSVRQLQNICGLHTGMTPPFVIPFYYGLQYLLRSSFESIKLPDEYSAHKPFFRECLNFIDKNLPSYQNFL
jgi:CheY-like chemotaxis protein